MQAVMHCQSSRLAPEWTSFRVAGDPAGALPRFAIAVPDHVTASLAIAAGERDNDARPGLRTS